MALSARVMERGELLWEYRPPRAHPIVYAGMLVFGFVFATGSLENVLRDNKAVLYALYAAPFLCAVATYILLRRSPTRIHADGIAPSRPLLARAFRPFVRWDEL